MRVFDIISEHGNVGVLVCPSLESALCIVEDGTYGFFKLCNVNDGELCGHVILSKSGTRNIIWKEEFYNEF